MKDCEDIKKQQIKESRIIESKDFPKVVLIDTVSLCNLRCSMCVHDKMLRKKGKMSWDLFKKIIDEIAETDKDIRVWMVFFGEALILKRTKPSIFDMLKYAKDRGLSDIVLNSNANLMDNETAKRLIESGLDAIYIGIDAYTSETYSKLRVGGDHRTAVDNTVNLINLKRKMNSKNPEVYVQFVEMDINKDEKKDFISFWKKKGAIVKIRPKVSWAGMIDAPNLVLGDNERWPCYWAMRTMSITDIGKVVTCAVDLDARFVAGDITGQTIREVWTGRLKQFREKHLNGRFDELPQPCRSCKDWQSAKADYYSVNK